MATVKFSDEMPKPTSIKGTDRFLISDGVTGEAKAPDFNQAKEYLNITGIEMEPLVGGTTSGTALVVPNGPAGEQRTAEVSSGKWYDFGSGPVEASADRRWKSYWNGTSWALKDMGALPQTEAVDFLDTTNPDAISGKGIDDGLKNDLSGGDKKIATATTVKQVSDRADFYDRPDLDNKSLIVDNENNIIDEFLTEKSDSPKLLPNGLGLDYVDRPDLGDIIMVDKDGMIVSSGESSSGGGSIPELSLAVWNPPAQEGFSIENEGNDTRVGNYDTLISDFDAIMASGNVNPNIDPYITKRSIGNSKVGNIPTYMYSLKPINPKMKMLLVGGTHANEKIYVWSVHSFIKELVENWTSHPFLEYLRWNVQIDVIPCRSPYTLANDVRKRGFRVIPETPPIPFTWTKSGTNVTLTFNVSDFPDDGFLSGATYFSSVPASALVNKSSLGIITSSDEAAVPLNAYRIGGVLAGNSITFTAPSGGASSGTGTFQVWTDPNRNFSYFNKPETWNDFAGATTVQPNDAGNVVGFFDNKGTRPFSLKEDRNLISLIESENYDYALDTHSDAASNDLRFVTDAGLVPNLSRIMAESGAFNNSTFNILDYTPYSGFGAQPNAIAVIPRNWGLNFHTVEWKPGLYSATADNVRDAIRWMGIVIKDSVTQIVNKKNGI